MLLGTLAMIALTLKFHEAILPNSSHVLPDFKVDFHLNMKH